MEAKTEKDFLNCTKCPFKSECENENWWEEDCWTYISNYFLNKLENKHDKQNGWELVSEIRKMCADEQLIPNYEEDNYEAGFNDAKNDVIDFIDYKLKEAKKNEKFENSMEWKLMKKIYDKWNKIYNKNITPEAKLDLFANYINVQANMTEQRELQKKINVVGKIRTKRKHCLIVLL